MSLYVYGYARDFVFADADGYHVAPDTHDVTVYKEGRPIASVPPGAWTLVSLVAPSEVSE